MKKYKKLIGIILDKPLGFALVSTIFTTILGLLVYRPFFEENDDIAVSLLTEGAYGNNEYHLVFVHSVLGRIESFLSRVLPYLRWHTLLQYLFIFIACFIMTYYLSHYRRGRSASFIIQLACFYELYVSMQFTKTVSFISIVGIMIILDVVRNRIIKKRETSLYGRNKLFRVKLSRKAEKASLAVSYIILLYAMMLRVDAFEMTVAIALIPGLLCFVSLAKRYDIKILINYIAHVAPVFAVMLVLAVIDKYVYASSPEWSNYLNYNQSRSYMVDYYNDALQYDLYGDKLAALGVSENDAYMYVTWQFADESVVTPQLMGDIVDITAKRKVDIDFIKAFVQNFYNDIFVFNGVIISGFVLLCLILVISDTKSRGILFALLELVLMGVIFLYFHYMNRWCHRVIFALLIAFVVSSVFVLITEEDTFFVSKRSKKRHNLQVGVPFSVLLMLLVITAVSSRLGNEFEYQEYLRSDKSFEVLQMFMDENKDTLFVADTFSIGDIYKYSVFSPSKKGSLDNYVTTGGWMTSSPIEHAVVSKFGYFDPFDALRRGSDNVILVDNFCPDRKALYLTEHGEGPRYAAEYIENVCGYNLYKIK